MMLPVHIDFLAHKIVVIQLPREKMVEVCGDPVGGYDFAKLEIYICSELPDTRKEETLLHEVMEMLLYYGGSFGTRKDFNHDAFTKYVSMLYAIIKQNKLLGGVYDSQMPKVQKRK